MLEQIGINIQVKKEKIKNILSELFKECNIHYFDHENTWEIEDYINLNADSICFSFIKNKSEFPIRIELTRTPNENTEEREQYLAKIFSDLLKCKTITNYKEIDKPKEYPSDSIIFENDKAYFAFDNNTIWADGEGGKVEIRNEIEFINYQFDNKANLISGSS